MQKLIRYVAVAVVAGTLALSQTAWAGECCKKAGEQAKKGETCSKCSADAPGCCKKAMDKASKDKDAKACAKCSKKEKSKA